MHRLVSVQLGLIWETLCTDRTDVVNRALMFNALRLPTEALPAHGARKGLYPCVNRLMSLQIRPAPELFPTVRAVDRSAVRADRSAVGAETFVNLAEDWTFREWDAVVFPLMLQQLVFVSPGFLTNGTFVLHVNRHVSH